MCDKFLQNVDQTMETPPPFGQPRGIPCGHPAASGTAKCIQQFSWVELPKPGGKQHGNLPVRTAAAIQWPIKASTANQYSRQAFFFSLGDPPPGRGYRWVPRVLGTPPGGGGGAGGVVSRRPGRRTFLAYWTPIFWGGSGDPPPLGEGVGGVGGWSKGTPPGLPKNTLN